jgi:hypothetical protein
MTMETMRRGASRPLAALVILAMGLAATAAGAGDAPIAGEAEALRNLDAVNDGITLDQRLADQYTAPLGVLPPVAAVPRDLDDPTLLALEAARDSAYSGDRAGRSALAPVEPPGAVRTALLLLASIAMLGFAAAIVGYAVRELMKDNERHRRERRRIRPHAA